MPGHGESERIVLPRQPEAFAEALGGEGPPAASAGAADLRAVLQEEGASVRPLFGLAEATPADFAEGSTESEAGLPAFLQVEAPQARLESLARRLRALPSVEAAYVKPPAEPATLLEPALSPDFTAQQGYLDPAPKGVDARWAWTQPGGRGKGVRVIDIEGAWLTTHEDLRANSLGVLAGTPTSDIGWRNHGTAVWGEIGGDRNAFGVTGIAGDAKLGAVSIFGAAPWGSARAIVEAAKKLGQGDVLLLELHRPGPNATGVGQKGYIAIEWWPDDLAAVLYAVRRGVIVVEAAGNGAENLDAAVYDTPGSGFPPTWKNPFRRSPVDSGAIVVGAGAPPSGNHGPDRSRLDFSNYGRCVDAQGWGREVVTCGYGDLSGGGGPEDRWYTASFSGTSSASPIVVGAVASLQGMLKAAGAPPATPATARAALRATGSPQQDAPTRPRTQRIGNRPDLRALRAHVLGGPIA